MTRRLHAGWHERFGRVVAATLLIMAGAVTLTVPAGAQAVNCQHETGIFPTEYTVGFGFGLVTGGKGRVQRVQNVFPPQCTGGQENDYAVNELLDAGAGAGVYMETGFLELGVGSSPHFYNIFFQVNVPGGVFIQRFPYTRCGYTQFPANNGYTSFRVYRYWASVWAADVSCNNNSTWTAIDNYTFSVTYSISYARTEFSRHSDQNSAVAYWSTLQYRDYTSGVWYNWPSMQCIGSSTLTNVNLNRLSGNSWNLTPGSGVC